MLCDFAQLWSDIDYVTVTSDVLQTFKVKRSKAEVTLVFGICTSVNILARANGAPIKNLETHLYSIQNSINKNLINGRYIMAGVAIQKKTIKWSERNSYT